MRNIQSLRGRQVCYTLDHTHDQYTMALLKSCFRHGLSGGDAAFCVLSSSCGVGLWQLRTCQFRLSFSWDGLAHELLDVVFFGLA